MTGRTSGGHGSDQNIAASEEAGPVRLLLAPEEAAETLGVGRTTLFRLLSEGRLASVRIGGCRRITPDALHDFVVGLDGAHRQQPAKVADDQQSRQRRPGRDGHAGLGLHLALGFEDVTGA